jgi:hypothetical protein
MRYAGWIVGLAVLIYCGIMWQKTSLYFPFNGPKHFLSTKTDAVVYNPVFLTAFYGHISTSSLVMTVGILQFFPQLWSRHSTWHRRVGQVYIFFILLVAAPTGLVLGYYANGGLPAKAGFMLQSTVWWLLTFWAFKQAKRRQWQLHGQWMLRSYAVTVAAISLRSWSYLMFYGFHTKPIETYVTVTWLSWVGNLIIAEIMIQIFPHFHTTTT